MPQVSFIVPVYKIKEEYLRECIDSIVNQTLTDIEILLIDDGSPDNCGEICDEYARKDARVKVFHQSNQGVSAARNKGIAHATGEWITFVDADDWVELDMCESLLAELDEDDSETDIVMFSGFKNYIDKEIGFSCARTKTKPHKKMEFDIEERKTSLKKYILGDLGNSTSMIYIPRSESSCYKLYRNNLMKNASLKFDINIGRNEDTIFTLKSIDCANKVIYLHKELYHYRMRKSSAVHSYSNKLDKDIHRTIEAYDSYISSNASYNNFIDCYNRKIFHFAFAVICRQYYNKENRIPCIEKWRKSRSLIKSNTYARPLNDVKLYTKEEILIYILVKLNLFILFPIISSLRSRFLNFNAYD